MLELIEGFEKSIEVFKNGEKKHGYELLKFEPFKQIYVDMFSGMHPEALGVLSLLPDPYFKELIETELEARRTKARLLKTRGRLSRQGGTVCLIL